MSRDPAYLEDILHAARPVRVGTEGISREAFTQDWMRRSAVAYQIEIIGEATKRLSDDL